MTRLKFLYRPNWRYDDVDKRWYHIEFKLMLHYSENNGETWIPVESEEYPNKEQAEYLLNKYKHD